MQPEHSPSTTDNPIPLCIPEIQGNEWLYIKDCLDTGWVSSVGAYVDKFENALRHYTGAGHAVATVNGTAALHVALLCAGVGPEDEVLVPCITFIAPANAVRYTGAWPVFIDVEDRYWQMDPQRVDDFLRRGCVYRNRQLTNKTTGRRVAAILPVHILGHAVDMDPILELAHRFELPVIEDATEGLGAKYKNRPLGTIGDIGCFSFNGNKIITTGGGGMIVSNNPDWAEKARYLTTQAKDNPIEYIHNEIGYNYRLTNLQAAMGCAQMEMLDRFVAAKRRIASYYNDHLSKVKGIILPNESPDTFSTFWLYTIRVNERDYGMDCRGLMKKLANRNIQTRPLWQPLHCSPAHASSPKIGGEVAQRLFNEGLSIPCSVGLPTTHQKQVIQAIDSYATN
ncbi:MAG: LegC family aminotransferase [Desulfobacteraceae bacterium]|nr:MAG: LegC family aminotransferase [Desulfobacteraceae bacterium]